MPDQISIPTSLASAAFLALAVFLFFSLRSAQERKATLGIALASYLLKIALIPLYYQYLVSVGLGGFAYPDTVRYHEWATQMAVEISHDLPHRHWGWTILSNGYFILCAYVYSFLGPNTILMRLLNAAVSSFSLLYVHRIGADFFDKRVARIATILAAFLPYSMIIVVEQRKDPIAVFLALMGFYHGTKIIRGSGSQLVHLAWMLAAMVPMYFVRSGFILPFLAVILFSWVLSRRDLLMAIAAAVPAALLALAIQYVTPEDSQVSVGYSVERLQGKANNATFVSQTGSGLMRFAYVASPTQIWKAPLSGGLLLITPFPPVLGAKRKISIVTSWSNVPNLLLYPFLLSAVLAIIFGKEKKQRMVLLLYPAAFLTIIGAFNPSVTRYREVVFPVILVLIAHGIRLPWRPIPFAVVYGLLGGLAVIVYAYGRA